MNSHTTSKHYIVTQDHFGTFKVVCLAHEVAGRMKQVEAEALSNSLNLESARLQDGFGVDDPMSVRVG